MIAIPNKGRLAEPSAKILDRCGLRRIDDDRSYLSGTTTAGVKVLSVRAADIPTYVYHGIADLGITGRDIILEGGLDVYELSDLGFGGCELVVAVKKESPYIQPSDIPSGSKVATEFPNLTRRYFNDNGVDVEVITLRGAVEIAPTLGLADAISDLSVTGNTLARNGLRPIGRIIGSTARLICNKVSYKMNCDEIKGLATKIEGCK